MKKQLHVFGAAVSVILSIAGVCRGALDTTLSWDPSLLDVSGQALSETVGYKLFFSDSSGVYSQYVDVGSATVANVQGLEYNKTYFFRAKAYTASGESAYSAEVAWIAPVMPDADADGISDSWEMAHFAALDVANSSTDFDQNGVSDLNEFLAGTSPVDPDDSVALEIQAGASGAMLSFQARQPSGDGYENRSRYYTLKQCSDLTSGIWTSVPGQENILAANQTVSLQVTADIRNAFYCTEIRLN